MIFQYTQVGYFTLFKYILFGNSALFQTRPYSLQILWIWVPVSNKIKHTFLVMLFILFSLSSKTDTTIYIYIFIVSQ